MGLYSEVFNSFEEFGSHMIGVLQTKDLESMLDCYWLAPDGKLYKVGNDPCFTMKQDIAPAPKRQRVAPYHYTGALNMYGVRNGVFREVTCLMDEGRIVSWWNTNVLTISAG